MTPTDSFKHVPSTILSPDRLSLLRDAFADYRQRFCQVPTRVREAADEAATITSELILLDDRISKNHSILVGHQLQQARKMLTEMRPEPGENPEFDAFLQNLPNLRFDSMTAVYGAGAGDLPLPPELQPVTLQQQIDVTAFYQRAHRLLKVMGTLPGLAGIACMPITLVRNKLIEHPEEKPGSRTMWSFGYSTSVGPLVRPMWNTPTPPVHEDEGYFVNRAAFIRDLVSKIMQVRASPTDFGL